MLLGMPGRTLALACLVGLVGVADAVADPSPAFDADFAGVKKTLAHGRVITTDEGYHFLVLTETAHACDEPLWSGFPGYFVVVFFADASLDKVKLVAFSNLHETVPVPGTATVKVNHGRASGTVDAPPKLGYGGHGTVDAEICAGILKR